MGTLGDLFGGLLKPLLVALLVIVALGLVSTRPDMAASGAGAGCAQVFDDPDINRLLCRLDPVRLWNTPVADLLPAWAANGE